MRLPSFIERVLLLNDSLMVEWKIDPFERRFFDAAHAVIHVGGNKLRALNCSFLSIKSSPESYSKQQQKTVLHILLLGLVPIR